MKKNFILTVTLCGASLLFTQQVCGATLPPVRDKSASTKMVGAKAVETEMWEFYSATEEPTSEELATLASSHKLGQKIAYLYDSFRDIYVVKEEVVPGDPARRTVIRKPEIYNAVRSIEKELNRSVKKNQLTQEKAEAELSNVLKIALAAIDSDTDSFETALQKHKKDASQLLAVFRRVNLKSIY